jgi:HemY protein
MLIRGIFWLLILFAAAAAVATLGAGDAGQVLIVFPPYRVDISLNLFVLALVVGFIVLYASIRSIRTVLKMPMRVAAYRARAKTAKAHRALRDAIGNLYAGRFSRAEKAAREASALLENKDAAGLIGATAAHRMREYTRRDDWLSQIDGADWRDARLMTTAELRADGRDAEGALTALQQSQGGRRIHAQQIALRAQQQLKNWAEVQKLVKSLEKREAIHPAVAVRLRQLAAENLLRDRRYDADALLTLWHALTPAERRSPHLADLAAELLIALERRADARKVIEEALAHNWDARLLRRYPETAADDPLPLIQRAEAWRKGRSEDPDLLFALGLLCLRQQLWGKAQAFLEQVLKLADNEPLRIRAHRALALLHEELGHADEATRHYRASAMAIDPV